MNPARREPERMRSQNQGARSEDFDIRNLLRNDAPDLRSVQSTDASRVPLVASANSRTVTA
jgi:hypothetical protein